MSGKYTVGAWKPFLEEPFGHVQGAQPGSGTGRALGRDDDLVHCWAVEGYRIGPLQPPKEPVGVQHCSLGDPPQPVGAVGR